MSESVVNAGDVEESVTQVLTHFVQGGGEQAAMSVQLLAEQVEIDLEYDEGSLSKWHNFLGRTLSDFFKSKNPALLGKVWYGMPQQSQFSTKPAT